MATEEVSAMEVVPSAPSESTESVALAAAAVKISFGVKKRPQTNFVQVTSETTAVLAAAVHSDEEEYDDEEEAKAAKRRKLTHLENGMAPLDPDEEAKKAPLVIAKPEELDWRVQRMVEQEKDGSITNEDRARLEILSQANPQLAEIRKQQNGTEASSENENGEGAIFVDAFKKNTEDADYNKVPISSFGLALLRGCGWKDGEGIGKNPKVVPLRLPERRPKGLGLGATPKNDPTKKDGKAGSKEEKISQEIRSGTCIRVTQGIHKGAYAKVESRDDDNAALFVRLALGSKAVKVSLYYVYAVSQTEYDREGKCINKKAYDDAKERLDGEKEKDGRRDREEKSSRRDERGDKREKERDRRREEDDDTTVWCRPDCVVRIVSDKYKNGKYLDQKMRVVDAPDRKSISLQDDRGVTHYNMRQSWLETVMPRAPGEKVMVVHGRLAGERAVLVEKVKEKQMIYAKLLNSQEMVKLSFDDACLWKPQVVDIDDDDLE